MTSCNSMPLHRGVQYFAQAMRIFLVDGIPLGFAHLLKDDLLGHLRGDTAQHIRRLVIADFAARFPPRRQSPGVIQRDLVDWIFQLFRGLDHRFVNVGPDLTRFPVQLGPHVLLRLVVLTRG